MFREPLAVLRSFFRFFEGWWFEVGSVSLEEFAEILFLQGSTAGRQWDHLLDWWPQIQSKNVLALCYEDCVLAPQKVPFVVADFLNLQLDPNVMKVVVEQTSKDFMLGQENKFDEHVLREIRDPVWGLPPGEKSGKVVASGPDLEVSSKVHQALDDVWSETIEAALNFKNYNEFRHALPNPLGVAR